MKPKLPMLLALLFLCSGLLASPERDPALQSRMNEANSLYAKGEYRGAITVMKSVLIMASQLYGERSVEYAELEDSLGMIHARVGDYEQADAYFNSSAEVLISSGRVPHSNILRIYEWRAYMYWAKGEVRRSVENSENAISLARSVYGENSVIEATLLKRIGNNYLINEPLKAEKYYLQAIEILEKDSSRESQLQLASTLDSLKSVYWRDEVNQASRVESSLKRALEIYKKYDHPMAGTIESDLDSFYKRRDARMQSTK